MAVKIRFARMGKTHAPMYRVVAIDSRKKRDGEALEILGTFDPIAGKIVQFHAERVQAWVDKGAILTDSVKKIQKMHKRQLAV